jgi:hypothetical protein
MHEIFHIRHTCSSVCPSVTTFVLTGWFPQKAIVLVFETDISSLYVLQNWCKSLSDLWSSSSIVGFEVLTAVVTKCSIFWEATTCSPLKVNWQQSVSTCYLLHAGFLLDLFSDPEDEGDMILRNVGRLSTDYTALHPRRQSCSSLVCIITWSSENSVVLIFYFNLCRSCLLNSSIK